MPVFGASENIDVKTVYMHLTKKCNLSCVYCYFNAQKVVPNELSVNEYRQLFSDVISLSPKRLIISGGEPLVRQDLFEIAEAFQQANITKKTKLCLITNGTLIDSRAAKRIASLFDEVRVSMDGYQEVHDKLRGGGTFEAGLQGIEHLKGAGITPHITTTVTSTNIGNIASFLEFLFFDKRINDFHLCPFKRVGRGASHKEFEVSLENIGLVIDSFNKKCCGTQSEANKNSAQLNDFLREFNNSKIGESINIHPDGGVYSCHVTALREYCLGNVRSKGLLSILSESRALLCLRSMDYKKVLQKINKESQYTPYLKDIYLKTKCGIGGT